MTKFKTKYLIGIDEVGRGPLAGPVVVAALALPLNSKFKIQKSKLQSKIKNKKIKLLLRDSKKLTPKQREDWFEFIKKSALCYSIASVSAKRIDRIGISNAANLAAKNAFRRLIKNSKLRIKNCKTYLDGGLYLKGLKAKSSKLKVKTVIKGDEKIPAIMLASIIAKVTRDRLMLRLHKKYPKYGFDHHKGYGTKAHIKAIKKHGLTPIHRSSFRIKN
ncbi:MAG: ribonuclease HII [Patescibacteria group bacterium]